jgi:hypothetical protein
MPLAKSGATAGTGSCPPPPNPPVGVLTAGRWIRSGHSPPKFGQTDPRVSVTPGTMPWS